MSLLARFTGLEGRNLGRRAGLVLGGFAAAALLAGVGVGFLGVAVFALLTPAFGTAGAALAVGLIGLALAALAAAVAAVALQRARREVGSAVRGSAMLTFAPPLLGMAARRSGVLGVLALGAFTLLMSRRS